MKVPMIVMMLMLSMSVMALQIESPLPQQYATQDILLKVTADVTYDQITLLSEGVDSVLCTNCSSAESDLTAPEGSHTLEVKGLLGNTTDVATVTFSVVLPIANVTIPVVNYTNVTPVLNDTNTTVPVINDTNTTVPGVNETNTTLPGTNTTTPRFTLGYNKLPQAVAKGNISDAELAAIIRSNKLNPGILNRLIKSKMLGEESVNAILDTQFQPKGIFRKLMSYVSKQPTYSSMIYENYNLTDSTESKLLNRTDLPKDKAEKIQQKMKAKVQEHKKEQKGNRSVIVLGGQGKKKVQENKGKKDESKGEGKKVDLTPEKGKSKEQKSVDGNGKSSEKSPKSSGNSGNGNSKGKGKKD